MNLKPISFTLSHDGIARELKTEIHIALPFKPSDGKFEFIDIKDHKIFKYYAIWDTGATSSVITKKVVDECELKPISRVKVNTVSGEDESLVYLVSLFLPNKIVIPQLSVIEGVISGDSNALIGMDVITKGDLAITNKDGKTIFSFRIPSITNIDFVKPRKPFPI